MLIHKIDSVTGEGIYGVTFLVSDARHNPIGQYTSDQNGYVYIDRELKDGKYYVQEIQPAEGYLIDHTEKTFMWNTAKPVILHGRIHRRWDRFRLQRNLRMITRSTA